MPPGCGGGGARGRRHWLVGAGNGHSASSRAALSGVAGNDGVVRLVVAVSTLLGPEGTTLGRPCAGARGLADDPWFAGGCLSVWLPGMAWSLIPFGSVVGRWWSAGGSGVWWVAAGCGLVVG